MCACKQSKLAKSLFNFELLRFYFSCASLQLAWLPRLSPMEFNSFKSLSDLPSRTSDLTLSLYASSSGTRLHGRFFWQQKQLTCFPRNDLNLAVLLLHFNDSAVQHALHHMAPFDPFGDYCDFHQHLYIEPKLNLEAFKCEREYLPHVGIVVRCSASECTALPLTW